MTPSQKKAKARSKELYDFYYSAFYSPEECNRCFLCKENVCSKKHKYAIKLSNDLCDRIIETLSEMKGMGKIGKIKYWKHVKSFLEDEK